MKQSYIQPISLGMSLSSPTPENMGGKAWNLMQLQTLGYQTPEWWLVPSPVFHQSLGNRQRKISNLLEEINPDDSQSILQVAAAIEALIGKAILPECLLTDLSGVLPDGHRYAVRSSIVGEDSDVHSYAGQMESFINIDKASLADHIKKVWISAYGSRALLYRLQRGIGVDHISVAVIVQTLVVAKQSGVLFTKKRIGQNDDCLVSAVFGLGDGATSDQAQNDIYTVNRHSGRISASIALKSHQVTKTEGIGVQVSVLPKRLKKTQVLSHKQIKTLCDTGLAIEQKYGYPIDCEWCIDRQNRLWLLQVRPVTVHANSAYDADDNIWDNANIIESYPGITSPLTFSFIGRAYRSTFDRLLAHLCPWQKRAERVRICDNLLGRFDGRVYYNLSNWYAFLALVPGFKSRKRAWENMIGINTSIEPPLTKTSMVNSTITWSLMVWYLLTVDLTGRRFFRQFDKTINAVSNISGRDPQQLQQSFLQLEYRCSRFWFLTLINDFCAMTYYAVLQKLIAKWAAKPKPGLVNACLYGCSGVESIQPLVQIDRICALFEQNAIYMALLADTDDSAVYKRIQLRPDLKPLKQYLDDYLGRFGDRCIEDLKLESSSYREHPELLIALLRQALAAGKHALRQQSSTTETPTVEQPPVVLSGPLKRIIFNAVLKQAKRSIKQRENMRFARSRVYGKVRSIFLHMGTLLATQKAIAEQRDIFYLTIDEIFAYINASATSDDIQALITLRKNQNQQHLTQRPDDRFSTHGIAYISQRHVFEMEIHPNGVNLSGAGCSPGIAVGKAKIITDPVNTQVEPGCIIIAHSTDPGWAFHLATAKGIVVEKGSVLSHTAIISRELGIPSVVGLSGATKTIADGATVRIDGSTGVVQCQ